MWNAKVAAVLQGGEKRAGSFSIIKKEKNVEVGFR